MTEIRSISNSEHYIWGHACDGWHLLRYDEVSIIQERIPAGESEVTHFHNVSRQFFYVLSGTATVQVGSETILLHPGEGLEVPPKVHHQFRNDSKRDVSFLVVSVPKSHGDRVNIDAES